MAREHHVEKGRRYVAEGRLNVTHVSRSGIAASCRGSGTVYAVGWTPERGWRCSCPAKTRCAHLFALMLTTVVSDHRDREDAP